MRDPLITVSLCAVLATVLAAIARMIARASHAGGGDLVEHQGATIEWEPTTLADARTEEYDAQALVAASAAAVPDELALSDEEARRVLTGAWRGFVQTPPTVELLPLVPGRPYVGRHHDDTVEVVPADYQPRYGFARIDAEAAR
jgi:hypothetical protein